jgi:hypothetical protein
MVFFAFAGGWPLIGVFLMVFLIGAFKAFMVWQQQKQAMRMFQQPQQQMPAVPTMPQSPMPEPPVNNRAANNNPQGPAVNQ